MDADLWLPKMTLLSRREPVPGDDSTPFPFSTGDESSKEDDLITILLLADALRGEFGPLVPVCGSYR